MELIEIVDENGDFTGQIIDKDEAHDRNLLHNEVAVFIINDKGQVLLQKRSANKRFNPNQWGLCAGHVDAGESLESAALREMKEEVGIEVPADELKPYAEKVFIIRNSNSHVVYYYYVRLNLSEDDFVVQKEELSEVKWFYIDEAIDMIRQPNGPTVFDEDKIVFFERLKEL